MSLGVRELGSGQGPLGWVRRAGDGRKRLVEREPALRDVLLSLVELMCVGTPCRR